MRVWGQSFDNRVLRSTWDNELKLADTPYEDLHSLLEAFGLPLQFGGMGIGGHCFVVYGAPVAEIELQAEPIWEVMDLRIHLRPGLDKSRLKLTFIDRRTGTALVPAVRGDDMIPVDGLGGRSFAVRRTLADWSHAILYLGYDGQMQQAGTLKAVPTEHNARRQAIEPQLPTLFDVFSAPGGEPS